MLRENRMRVLATGYRAIELGALVLQQTKPTWSMARGGNNLRTPSV